MEITTTALTELTEDELAALVVTHADDADALAAILAEMDAREDEIAEPTEEQRRADLVAQSRRPGESLDQTVDRMYGEHTYDRYLAAEEACRGRMLKREFESDRGDAVDPYTLFHGTARRAAKYASRELLDWWTANGRLTWVEYRYQMLGRGSDAAGAAKARRMTQDWIR